jgi:cysteine desulfurase
LIMNNKVYFDYAATTPLDRQVLAEMTPYFLEIFGNPSSVHFFGQRAEAAIDNSRQTVASCLNCEPDEIIFTGGGTEGDNLALRGAAFAQRKLHKSNRILISPVEHHAVLRTAQQLSKLYGFTLGYLPADEYGRIDPDDVANLITNDTAVVSVIHANNEIGTINRVEGIAKICHRMGVPFHTDSVQAAAHLPIDFKRSHIDLLTIGAHKFYGPKGIGALLVRKGQNIIPALTGGSQESGLRPGTSNVPLIVGMAAALKSTCDNREDLSKHYRHLCDRLINGVLSNIPGSRLTGHPIERLPNHASFVFEKVDGNNLIMMLDTAGYACSSGSACKSGNPEPSEVLKAIGFSSAWALGSLRITLGKFTQEEHVEGVLHDLPEIIARIRQKN